MNLKRLIKLRDARSIPFKPLQPDADVSAWATSLRKTYEKLKKLEAECDAILQEVYKEHKKSKEYLAWLKNKSDEDLLDANEYKEEELKEELGYNKVYNKYDKAYGAFWHEIMSPNYYVFYRKMEKKKDLTDDEKFIMGFAKTALSYDPEY